MPTFLNTSRKTRQRRRSLGDLVCNITPNGARLCYDSNSTQIAGAAAVNTSAANAAMDPRPWRTPRTYTYVPPAATATTVTPTPVTAIDPNAGTLASALTNALPSVLTDQTIVAGYPNWKVLGAGAAAVYVLRKFVFTGRRR